MNTDNVMAEVKKLVPEAVGAELRELLDAGEKAKATLTTTTARLTEVTAELSAYKAKESAVASRESAVGSRESAATKREGELILAEKQAAVSAARGDAAYQIVQMVFANNIIKRTVMESGGGTQPNGQYVGTNANRNEEQVG